MKNIASFVISEKSLHGSFKSGAEIFTVNGKTGLAEQKNGGSILSFRLKNGKLECSVQNRECLWNFIPFHGGSFSERINVAPFEKKLEIKGVAAELECPAKTAPSLEPIKATIDPAIYINHSNGDNSFVLDSHGHDFELEFGDAVFKSSNGGEVSGSSFETEGFLLKSFSIDRDDEKWIISWVKEDSRKTLVFNMRGEDGQIRINDAFIMISNGKANNVEGFEITKKGDSWFVTFDAGDKSSFMVSTAKGTVSGVIENDQCVLNENSYRDILSGEFTLSFDTEIKFMINNREAKLDENRTPYFIMAEGKLFLHKNGKNVRYVFHPSDNITGKSFTRRIDLMVKYPDGTPEIFENLAVQQFSLPSVKLEKQGEGEI